MTEISLDSKKNQLKINSYNGNSREIFQQEADLGRDFSQEWNFFRENNNHTYTKGSVFYEGRCENNLVISLHQSNNLTDIKNAFVCAGDSFIEISPISNMFKIIDEGRRILSGQKIHYHIPKSVFERENLGKKKLGYLKWTINEHYGVSPRKITPASSRSKKGGVYYLEDKKGQKYFFKFKSKDRNHAELLSEIAESIPDLFPQIYPKIGSLDYTLKMNDGWYGLESFIEGKPRERNLDYFSLLGENIRLLHQNLANFFRDNQKARVVLSSAYHHLSESNIASIYLDLMIKNSDNAFLLSELERIIGEDLSSKSSYLPKFLVHRDLNQSNVLWTREKPILIDSESIGISERVNEFIPALLLQGNRNRPNYVLNSLNAIVSSYNRTTDNSLSSEEESVFPEILKYSLIRYHVIRNIRRNFAVKK